MKALWGKPYFLGLSLLLVTFFTDWHIGGQSDEKPVTALPHTMPQPGSRIGLPFGFELNRGQADPRVRFLCRRSQTALYLTDNEAIFIPNAAKPAALRMKLHGANPHPQLHGVAAQSGRINYFCGSNRQQWRANIPLFARVRCVQVYPGVDLVFYSNGSQLEYDLVVAPGADPSRITLEFTGAQRKSIHRNGDLILSVGETPIRMHRPVIYQERRGRRRILAGGFQRRGRNSFGFQVAEYDHARPLIIDPEISFSTCLGGSGEDIGNGVAVDGEGSAAYITGYTASTSGFAVNAIDQTHNGGTYDAFVAKVDPQKGQLYYCTYLGGNGDDRGCSIAVDATGCAYITGYTSSTNTPDNSKGFPRQGAFQYNYGGGQYDAFVAKLSATGGALLYGSYLGSNGEDKGLGIAVANVGGYCYAYVTGYTYPQSGLNARLFPTTASTLRSNWSDTYFTDAFVAKMDLGKTGAASLGYSTYLGGMGMDYGAGITVTSAGNAYVTGHTNSNDFPKTNGCFQAARCGGYDCFVTALNSAGSMLVYSTYLGGSDIDQGAAITVDNTGSAYVTGYTSSNNFPRLNAWQNTKKSTKDAFIARLSTTGSSLIYSTYFGGTYDDEGSGIAVDSNGNALVTGYTVSKDFPTYPPIARNDGSADAFALRLSADGQHLNYSLYLGGTGTDKGLGIAVDSANNAYVTGFTGSSNFPVLHNLQSFGGYTDALLVCLRPVSPLPVRLAEWQACHQGNTVQFSWRITEGADAIGFYLLRGPGPEGPFTRLNRRLLPADGERDAYHFTDHAAFPEAYYCLEIITAAGTSIRSAPIRCP